MKTSYASTAGEWRSWLAQNSGSEKEVWLVICHSRSAMPSPRYHEAIEHACQGGGGSFGMVVVEGRPPKLPARPQRLSWPSSRRQTLSAGFRHPRLVPRRPYPAASPRPGCAPG
jgi:hypothetical protein